MLQASDGIIECSSADSNFVLQPKNSPGPLNGLFVDDDKKKGSLEKEDENKVRVSPFVDTLGKHKVDVWGRSKQFHDSSRGQASPPSRIQILATCLLPTTQRVIRKRHTN